ncbi:hypothetical protein Tco_0479250 [Tanacetum coccineum]
MHTRAYNSELVEPLPEPESTLNRRLRRRNRRVLYDQRNNPPQHPRIIYPPVLNINYFRHFLDILRNYDPMDDEPMWAADHVVAPTPGSAITIPETANEFAIKGNAPKLPWSQSVQRRIPYNQRNNPPQNPRIVYSPILNINYFCHFLLILENLYPMDDEPMWAADHVVALTPGSAITIPETVNKFAIKGNHLTLVKGNQIDGRTKTDHHKHIHEFLGIYDMFKHRDTENEAVRLMMFPLSLTGEAKTWLDELNEGTIKT